MQKKVYFIEGDGIGKDIWSATRPILEKALYQAYNGEHTIQWIEVLAGQKAFQETGEFLPEATIQALQNAELALKGPLETPVGKGFRSLNVTMRQTLDLYACIRPVRYFQGIESPVKHPERVDMVIFRENTEDVYAGLEWQAGSAEARRLIAFLRDELGAKVDEGSGIGIKPMSAFCSKRLIRKALRYTLDRQRKNVTLVHKGNIMKYTEGSFRNWGYEVAIEEFADSFIPENTAAMNPGKRIIQDRIADAMFQEVLLNPQNYDVIATSNLNGDYLSDALAAQVGGLGIAPGVNMSERIAIFEPTHGTAPLIAGKDKANPTSLILSGALLFEHAGFGEAASRIYRAVSEAIQEKHVTVDLAGQMQNANAVSCSHFGEILAEKIV